MKIPGMRFIKKVEQRGNQAGVPLAQDLGLVDFLRLAFKDEGEKIPERDRKPNDRRLASSDSQSGETA